MDGDAAEEKASSKLIALISCGVAAVPGSSFFKEGGEGIIRLHYAKKDETLIEALDRLSNIKKMLD